MTLSIRKLAIYNAKGNPLFNPLSFKVNKGEILSLMGPSGCGKSTLLNIIAGHTMDDFSFQGEIYLNDIKIDKLEPEKRKIGILFQDDLLFPHLNIWQNLAIALPRRFKKGERKDISMETLKELNLEALAESNPKQISGGQKSRVSIMRMLLAEPEAILLDEPFSKLDKSLRDEFRKWLFLEIKRRKLPTLMVTHQKLDVPDGGICLTYPWK